MNELSLIVPLKPETRKYSIYIMGLSMIIRINGQLCDKFWRFLRLASKQWIAKQEGLHCSVSNPVIVKTINLIKSVESSPGRA